MSELQPSSLRGKKGASSGHPVSSAGSFWDRGSIFLAFSMVIAAGPLHPGKEPAGADSQREDRNGAGRRGSHPQLYPGRVAAQDVSGYGPKYAFVLEAMSTSYVSRAVMDRLKEPAAEYQIGEWALNARNPAFEPKPFEVKLINNFAAQPRLAQLAGDHQSCRPVQFCACPAGLFHPGLHALSR